jgi:hypothetical protein
MRVPFVLSTILAAGACASQAPEVPTATLAQEQEITGFRIAVVDVCLASAQAGKPVSELATETGPIVAVADARVLAQVKAKPDDRVWSPRDAEAVLIRSNARECEVTTRGPLTRVALDAVGEALSDPHGFVAETRPEPKGSNIYKRYSKKVGAQTLRVTLAGSETGGEAPSSTLVATVTATPPA